MPEFYDETTPENLSSQEGEETSASVEAVNLDDPAGKSEFDISTFDFTIEDPGEIEEFSQMTSVSEPKPKPAEKNFSLSKISSLISEKAEKLMEEKPREEKPKKEKVFKEKPKKEKAVREFSPLSKIAAEEPEKTRSIQFTGGTFAQVSRRWLRYALRPSALYDGVTELLAPLFLVITMAFFGAFYLLLGLDWYFANLIAPGRLWGIVGVGLLVGGVAALSFGAGVQGLSLLLRREKIRPFRVMGPVAGACVYPGALLLLGFLIQLIFRASVSMSFGITALLWLIYTLFEVLRDMFGEKNLVKSAAFTALWGFVLFLIMTLTFSLK